MTAVTDERQAACRYTLDNGWEQARRRLQLIEECYDPGTIRRLSELGVGPGWRCLEVGPGGGSITRWLCSQVGPTGRVVAVDLDTRFVEEIEADNLDVHQADITTTDLPAGPFDLIHTRAVLMHLPSRDRVLGRLVAGLRPGGWLLVEEGDDFPIGALGAGLYRDGLTDFVAALTAAGVDFTWARRLPDLVARSGLSEVGVDIDLPYFEGGSPAAELLRLSVIQVRDLTVAAGAEPERLDAWDRLVGRPGQWFPGFAVVSVQGRRPAA